MVFLSVSLVLLFPKTEVALDVLGSSVFGIIGGSFCGLLAWLLTLGSMSWVPLAFVGGFLLFGFAIHYDDGVDPDFWEKVKMNLYMGWAVDEEKLFRYLKEKEERER